VNEDQQNLGGNGPWWKPGMVILSEVSTWIVAPIVLALIAGKALDNHYHTKPYFFFILIAVAFLVTVYGIVKAVSNYMKTIKDNESR
jgi:F0F1-type ATP synthase assembly protein I